MSSLSTHGSDDLLNSWKEIAAYLNRGVRTVQRWETDLGLPVHRPAGKSKSVVLALRSELNGWIVSCGSGHDTSDIPPQVEKLRHGFRIHGQVVSTRQLIEQCRALRAELRQTREAFRCAVKNYSMRVQEVTTVATGKRSRTSAAAR